MGALTLIGGVLSAAAAVSAGQAQARAADFNAQMAQQQADRERGIASREARAHRLQNSRSLATSRARRAGSGVTSQGSPLLVDEATAAAIELGAQNILSGGASRAYGLEQEAALSRARGRSARASGFLRAGGTLLTAASGTDYDSFLRFS